VRFYDNNGQEIPFNYDHFTVVITPRHDGQIDVSYHIYSNRLYVKFFVSNTHPLTTDFSLIVYKN